MTRDDLAVIRVHPRIAQDFPDLARRWDGVWLDLPVRWTAAAQDDEPWCEWTAVPTDRYEVRADGLRARVYEVRP